MCILFFSYIFQLTGDIFIAIIFWEIIHCSCLGSVFWLMECRKLENGKISYKLYKLCNEHHNPQEWVIYFLFFSCIWTTFHNDPSWFLQSILCVTILTLWLYGPLEQNIYTETLDVMSVEFSVIAVSHQMNQDSKYINIFFDIWLNKNWSVCWNFI